jgi:hypothetical protein
MKLTVAFGARSFIGKTLGREAASGHDVHLVDIAVRD